MRTVCSRQVLGDRRVSAFLRIEPMTRNATTSVQQLDDSCRDSSLKLKPDERLGHAVAMSLELDVLINMYSDGFKRCKLPLLSG